MEKISENWTPTNVTTTFKLSTTTLPDGGHRPTSVGPNVVTSICGFGWRFLVRAEELPRLTMVDNAGESVISYQVTILFDPYLVASGRYGTVLLRTTVIRLLPSARTPQSEQIQYVLPSSTVSELGQYIYPSKARAPSIISVSLTFPASLGLTLPRTLTWKMEETLESTLDGKEMVDVKFYAFSRWKLNADDKGVISHPLPLFANLRLLEGFSDDLDSLLKGEGFLEAAMTVDFDSYEPEDQEIDSTGYGYESDSDLESDTSSEANTSVTRHRIRNDLKATSGTDTEGKSGPGDIDATLPLHKSPPRNGRVVVLKGTAYKTWKALLSYLYTGRIQFQSLTSQAEKQQSSPALGGLGPHCSPKSMYRLADKLGLHDLQELALQTISAGISRENIIEEVFSSFTSMYPAIQELQTDFLVKNFPTPSDGLVEITQQICDGEKPYCAGTLKMVLEKLAKR
ncbi:hypothetical protein MIND_00900000 [Mycena indigotica]|uniref:BTB domain-containing protein n=1 Tax=Mycena indigotica TaxID=2126181 RepID=A0A8H6W520_9AGAR|nr:uncharacterized protein MIND_00900000 [Mycena indigotica]KAF7299499.1 hypothetical protein MIND_00900000 [Mycena indigotica]